MIGLVPNKTQTSLLAEANRTEHLIAQGGLAGTILVFTLCERRGRDESFAWICGTAFQIDHRGYLADLACRSAFCVEECPAEFGICHDERESLLEQPMAFARSTVTVNDTSVIVFGSGK